MSPNLDNRFFEGMVNLKVLAMSNMNFSPNLPESIRKLTRLRTLCMERCKLGNIDLISELGGLLALSLRESFFEELPVKIGELSKLRLLDLTRCMCGKVVLIPTGILSSLSKLEGLYLSNNNKHGVSVFGMDNCNGRREVIDKYRLPYLNAFNIDVLTTEGLPMDALSFEDIDRFRVYVGPEYIQCDSYKSFSRALYLQRIGDPEHLENSCVKTLLKRADYLNIWNVGEKFEHIVPLLDEDGFTNLSSLTISSCENLKYIVNGQTVDTFTVFAYLQSLELNYMDNLMMVCNGEASPGMFSNLKTLSILGLNRLSSGLPLVPRNLIYISVIGCHLLNFIFHDDVETQVIELSFLSSLVLEGIPNLLSLVGPKVSSINCDTLPMGQFFFDRKIVFPVLERLEMECCDNIVKLWSKESCGFQNLKDVKIKNFRKLTIIGSPSLFSTLVHLESLSIQECEAVCEVISGDEQEASEIGEQIINLPQLKFLELGALRNLACFYSGEANFEFPKLKKLILNDLLSMTSFIKLENSSSFFHEKIDFPCLEELQVRQMSNEVMGLWDSEASNRAPRLRYLELGTTKGLRQIPSVILENLSSLKLVDFEYEDVLFSSSDVGAKEQFVWTCSELLKLEELEVENSISLKELLKADDFCGVDVLTFCGQLKTLELTKLPALNPIPHNLFKSIASLSLDGLKWEHVISADMLGNSLQQLENLSIGDCQNMEALMINVESAIELPRLKTLRLYNLQSIKSFSSTPKKEATLRLPSLESLSLCACPRVEHFWIGSFFAPKLRYLSVTECDILQQVFKGNPEITTELPSLQDLFIMWCYRFKSVSSGPLSAHNLRDLKLHKCDDVECFLLGSSNKNGLIELRFLVDVHIGECPKLHSMSLLPLWISNLTHVQHNGEECSMVQFDDLNHFLQKVNVK